MSAYREPAPPAACDMCGCDAVRTGKDGLPYCGMHGEPRAVIDEWQVERLNRIESAARELLADLPRCTAVPDHGPQKMCGRLATHQEQGPAFEPYRCEEHRDGPDELPWADAAAKLAAELEE